MIKVKVYQYSNGEYLPDSSQPQNTVDYAIASGEYTPHEMIRFINVTLGEMAWRPERKLQVTGWICKSSCQCFMKEGKTVVVVRRVLQYVQCRPLRCDRTKKDFCILL